MSLKIEKVKKQERGILYARIPQELLSWVKLESVKKGYSTTTDYVVEMIKKVKEQNK